MIERYTLQRMKDVWEPENKFKKWFDIEVSACEALAEMGEIPASAVRVIKEKAQINIGRINDIELDVKHDVIAFLTAVSESIGDEAKYLHLGLTSSDVLDTGLALQLIDASDIILDDLKRLRDVLKAKACEYKDVVMIGRSHGIHAEPITFGLKMALWYEDTNRN
ncbi:MAG: lyase family protein, partial [Nitrospirota bacterium]